MSSARLTCIAMALVLASGCGLFSTVDGQACLEPSDCPASFTCVEESCVPIADGGVAVVDGARPDTAPSDSSRPDGALPDAVAADLLDAGVVDTLVLDAAAADVLVSDAAGLDTSAADAAVADTTAPDSAVSDAETVDASTSDTALPDTTLPDTALPDTALPDTATVDSSAVDAGPGSGLALFAVRPPIARQGDQITLEGIFPAGVISVSFPAGTPALFSSHPGSRRLTVTVPANAGSGNLTVSLNGEPSQPVLFRYTTFTPELGFFSPHYEQTGYAREMPRLGNWRTRSNTVRCGSWLYIVGGRIGGLPETDVRRARINADASLGPFEPAPHQLNVRRRGAAMAVAGDRVYVIGGENSDDGQLGSAEVATCDTAQSGGDLGPFVATASLLTPRMDAQAVVLGSSLYVIAGRECDSSSTCQIADVECAELAADGSITSFVSLGDLVTVPRDKFGLAVVGGRLYLFGGTQANHSVEVATINADGTLGAFTVLADLSQRRRSLGVLTTRHKVCLIGGEDGADPIASVECAAVNADDTLGGFATHHSLLAPRSEFGMALLGNRVYLIGGQDGSDDELDTLIQAPIHHGAEIDAFSSNGSLPGVLSHPACAVVGSRLYVTGGSSGDSFWSRQGLSSDIYYYSVGPGGALSPDAFDAGVDLPQALAFHRLAVSGGTLYAIGGQTALGSTGRVDAFLLLGADLQTSTSVETLLSSRATHVAATAHGKLLVMGGATTQGGRPMPHNDVEQAALPLGIGGSWSWFSSLGAGRAMPGIGILGENLYVLGGGDGDRTAYSTVDQASLAAGSIAAFGASGTALNSERAYPMVVAVGGRLFLLGGLAGSPGGYLQHLTIERSPLTTDGLLTGQFEAATSSLSGVSVRHGACAVVTGNKVHLLGGANGSQALDTIYSADIVDP